MKNIINTKAIKNDFQICGMQFDYELFEFSKKFYEIFEQKSFSSILRECEKEFLTGKIKMSDVKTTIKNYIPLEESKVQRMIYLSKKDHEIIKERCKEEKIFFSVFLNALLFFKLKSSIKELFGYEFNSINDFRNFFTEDFMKIEEVYIDKWSLTPKDFLIKYFGEEKGD